MQNGPLVTGRPKGLPACPHDRLVHDHLSYGRVITCARCGQRLVLRYEDMARCESWMEQLLIPQMGTCFGLLWQQRLGLALYEAYNSHPGRGVLAPTPHPDQEATALLASIRQR